MKRTKKSARGFSLMELLSILAVMAVMGALIAPALQSLSGAGTMNKAVSDIGETLGNARGYAMAHHTYVRVILSQIPLASGQLTPKVVVLSICPATGGLDQTDAASMGNSSRWPAISRPLIIDNLVISNALNATTPDTSLYPDPSQSNMVSSSASVTRQVGTLSPTFTSCLQYEPSGEAQITNGTPARYIKVGLDRPSPQNGKDPFLVRVSGISGDIDIVRKESGIQ